MMLVLLSSEHLGPVHSPIQEQFVSGYKHFPPFLQKPSLQTAACNHRQVCISLMSFISCGQTLHCMLFFKKAVSSKGSVLEVFKYLYLSDTVLLPTQWDMCSYCNKNSFLHSNKIHPCNSLYQIIYYYSSSYSENILTHLTLFSFPLNGA